MAWPGRGAAAVDPARAFSERPESESGCLKRARCQECGSMPIPDAPKLYRIVHVDRLRSIVADGRLLCDATMATRSGAGTMIGISGIKARRRENLLSSHAELRVGDCIPFYFCPRSIMLYMIYRQNDPSLAYKGGQGPIVHLEADMHDVVEWADKNTGDGLSRRPMRGLFILKTGAIWTDWTKSTGRRYNHGHGKIAKMKNRQNF